MLSLLFFRFFAFFGFPVKCAEAGCLVELRFILDMYIVILGVQNVSYGKPGASTLAPSEPFLLLGDTLGGHQSSRKDTWVPESHFL